MSSSIAFYVVDVNQIASIVGSGKLSLVEDLRGSLPEFFENDDPDDDELSLEDSLRAIVGVGLGNEDADYLQAVEVLCAHNGTEAILDSLQNCRGGFLDQLTFLKQAFATHIPIPISIEGAGEHTLFIGREKARPLADILAKQEEEGAICNREVYAARIEFLDLLKSVEGAGLDLVGFCQ